MSLSLQMLGTGNAFAKKYFNNNGLLLDENYTLLIDCGITAPLAMHRLEKSFSDVNATLITHIHADHVGGLEELALTLKHVHGKKMTLLLPETLIEPLWNNTLKGGLYQEDAVSSLSDIFDVKPMQPENTYKLSPTLSLEIIQTPHIPGKNSYSLLINNEIFYSADMTFQPGLLISLVRERGIRIILHDCQLGGTGVVHTTLEELMSLPKDVRERIKLMHYSDEQPDFVGLTGEMEFLEQHVNYKL
ncbi:MBL fold metallo-hydrolase [Paenibacillus sp. FSL R5-0887]|jgi:hydroxyacylglutathione hydrolase|uniref:MBL fold metallo-hydrolase n=1 Tax=Paenibacillus sp. FSL R5-0887 TaxID=2921662 RepID=UPI0030F4C757